MRKGWVLDRLRPCFYSFEFVFIPHVTHMYRVDHLTGPPLKILYFVLPPICTTPPPPSKHELTDRRTEGRGVEATLPPPWRLTKCCNPPKVWGTSYFWGVTKSCLSSGGGQCNWGVKKDIIFRGGEPVKWSTLYVLFYEGMFPKKCDRSQSVGHTFMSKHHLYQI